MHGILYLLQIFNIAKVLGLICRFSDLSVVADSKRMSSYMDMTQFQFNSSDKGAGK